MPSSNKVRGLARFVCIKWSVGRWKQELPICAEKMHRIEENMKVFFSDLDNTMIYSYRHEIGKEKICVEHYQGREVSFITKRTQELLEQAREQMLFIPVTTRTQEQYDRIDLGIGIPEYALVCNGGVLLVEGREDRGWYETSLASIMDCQEELRKAQHLMESDENRSFEVRNIRSLFLFTKSREPEKSVEYLAQKLDTGRVEVFQNGIKVYVVPKKLDKGTAIRRFLEAYGKEKGKDIFVMAAGDSIFDIPMLQCADLGIAPKALEDSGMLPKEILVLRGGRVFSEAVLEQALEMGGSR